MTTEASTPLMRQYQAAKAQVPQALLMFRLGDFYELFYEDAVTAARELEITLTSRNKDRGEPYRCAGCRITAAEGYIARLIQRGYRVAICEQMEEAGPGQEIGAARSHAGDHAGHGHGLQSASLAREQLSGRRLYEEWTQRPGLCRSIDRRVPND